MIKRIVVWCALVSTTLLSQDAIAQGSAGYPGVFDTSQVLHLNFTMEPTDFATIQNDLTFDIEVPAQFWADGDESILVSIRRKSADAIGGKVSYKVDINEFVDGQKWNNTNKLSIENGDDQDVVSEGLAWYMHRAAAGNLTSYSPSLAAWTTVTINGQHRGIYLNVEQVDKQFLRNRSLWISGETWLFFQDDLGAAEYEEGPTEISPTMEALNFAPFNQVGQLPPAPQGEPLQTLLNDRINMDAMLTLAAVNAFSNNPDEMFNHAKNFFWADFAPGTAPANSNGKRMYFPWDLDSAISGSANKSIYGQGTGPDPNQEPYQELILNDPVFRQQYNLIMLDLLNGPLSVGSLTAFLDDMEPVLTPYLAADPNNQIGDDIADHFDSLRNWVSARHASVYQQVIADLVPIPGDFDVDGDVDGRDFLVWQRNPSVGGLADWQTNYGTESLAANSTAVPEPGSLILFCALFALMPAPLRCATSRG
jgi:spore coat protein CotH